MSPRTVVIGGGVTGLAVGVASDALVLEASDRPGGICSSYYVRPGTTERLARPPADGGAHRFEVGGGHWIFGGSPEALALLDELSPMATFERRAAVHFASSGATVPYPFQDHVDALDPALADRARAEQAAAGATRGEAPETMAAWLQARFGPALCERFFDPFHERYTAGLHRELAPQDAYKSPRGQQGYNATFRYPTAGLDALARAMADHADVRYGAEVVAVDVRRQVVALADGAEVPYDRVVTTLPLDRSLALCGIDAAEVGRPDPHTSVLVANVGGRRGPACPDAHWVYEPESAAGFHRYGVYTNVDPGFAPHGDPDRVGLYVEHAFRGGARPSAEHLGAVARAGVDELVARGVVRDVDVVDLSWVPAAYTWRWPGSTWAADAIAALEGLGVRPAGRYARWHFQGIAESVAEGLAVGEELGGPGR
ncbi:MAG: FAD-dependent oxidoreductase [Acidimicrobiales bacterium]